MLKIATVHCKSVSQDVHIFFPMRRNINQSDSLICIIFFAWDDIYYSSKVKCMNVLLLSHITAIFNFMSGMGKMLNKPCDKQCDSVGLCSICFSLFVLFPPPASLHHCNDLCSMTHRITHLEH